MAEQARTSGHPASAAEYQTRAAQAKAHSQALRDVIAASAVVVKPDAS